MPCQGSFVQHIPTLMHDPFKSYVDFKNENTENMRESPLFPIKFFASKSEAPGLDSKFKMGGAGMTLALPSTKPV